MKTEEGGMEILITDDDPGIRALLGEILSDRGHRVTEAVDGRQGLTLCGKRRFDLAMVDIFMPNVDGLEMIRELHRTQPTLPIVAMSGVNSDFDWSLPAAEDFGAVIALEKPFVLPDFVNIVERIAAKGGAVPS
jgi:CheY-like chemotaxis protein